MSVPTSASKAASRKGCFEESIVGAMDRSSSKNSDAKSITGGLRPWFRAAATNDTITRPMRIVEKAQLMSAAEIDRTLQRLAHEIVEKSGGTKHLALIGIVRRGVPLAQRIAQAMRGIDGVNEIGRASCRERV